MALPVGVRWNTRLYSRMKTAKLTIPISEKSIRALHIGDTVRLSGTLVTARDAAHKYMIETFIRPLADSGSDVIPAGERPLYEELKCLLAGGVIYHCGPVVRRSPPSIPPARGGDAPTRQSRAGQGGQNEWQFVAAGPTTSIREEPYEPAIIAHFGLRGVIGKGGMGAATLHACQKHGAAYFHAIGGAASLIANAVKQVVTVHKLEAFGAPEALWVVHVEDFPAVVTMDSHGQSTHDQVEAASRASLERLLVGPDDY
jgi:fumarate hydratase subunit beta